MDLVIVGLSALDKEELAELLPEARFTHAEVPEGTLAEPATTAAIIALSTVAIQGLSLYFAKGRRRSKKRHAVRVVHPDGRIEENVLEIESESEEEALAEVADTIGRWHRQA